MQEIEPVALHRLTYEPPASKISIPWRSLLEERLRRRAQEAALFVAERMRDPAYVRAMAEVARKQSIYPSIWLSTDLVSGDVGLALMYSYFDACFPGQGFDALTQQYLSIMAMETRQLAFVSPELFGGTSGVAFVLSQASQGGKRYQKTLARLHEGLCDQVLSQQWRRFGAGGGIASNDYDLTSGAAGILAYLVSLEQADAAIQRVIAYLLAYLLWLGEPGQSLGQERWYIPPALLPNEEHRQDYPQGNFNCGLAHGIPGPLAALSLTWLAGYRYPGLRETISYLADWVAMHRVEQKWGIDWTDSVPLEAATASDKWQRLPPTRPAWCYGAPGVARSLWLAGCVLEDEELRRLGVEAIEGVLRRPVAEREIPSPILCHGVAGLLHICLRFAHECTSELVKTHIPILVEQILENFDSSLPLGFRNTDQGILRDQPAWLTGAPGIAMVLLAASTDVTPTWDRVLALA